MPFSRRRLVISAVLITSLIVAATMLRIGLEWRQALDDIDSMIVTPVVLPLSDSSDSFTNSSALSQRNTAQVPAATPQHPSTHASSTDAKVEALPELSSESLNILLMGTDARPSDPGPTRTDAIVLVRLSPDSGRVSMLSIPRDLWVTYPGGDEGRVNAAYALGETRYGPGGGAALVKSTIGKLMGLKVDHFVLINFQGFQTLIDRLGGINVDVPTEVYDPTYPTEDYGTIEVRFKPGRQLLDGERALIYARTRHADSDFGRNQRQQLVLMSIFNRIRERGLLQQLTSLDDYTGALRNYIRTDLTKANMLALGNFARDVRPDDVLRYAIDSGSIVELSRPKGATFAVEPKALRRLVSQFTGEAVSTAGGE